MKASQKITSLMLLTLLAGLLMAGQAWAQHEPTRIVGNEYRVGVGDRLHLAVPERSDLNRELVVNDAGAVTLPLIGDIQVIGLTIPEIETRFFQAMREMYPSIREVEITITEAVSQVIYVIGQVGQPGRFNFASAPNLWEAIREAGGPTPTASLENVRIVKDRKRGGGSSEVNVQIALESGTVDQLPDLEGGDTVIIPQRPTQAQPTYSGPAGVSVFGAVVRPGDYRLQGKKDLVSAILLAGGPTDMAKLDKVKIIRRSSDGSVKTMTIDLRKYLDKGDPMSNPQLNASDTVSVPSQNRFWFSMQSSTFILSALSTGVSIAALIVAASN